MKQDLAVVGDANVAAGQRDADGSEAKAVEAVDRGRGALSETVSLEDDDPEGVKELENLARDRRATRDPEAELAAEPGPNLGVDQPVGDAPLQLE